MKMKEEDEKFVVCKICGKRLGGINNSHLTTHGISVQEYKLKYPDAQLISKNSEQKMKGPRYHIRGNNSPYWIDRIEKTCAWCGKTYKTEARYETRSRFCSKQCRFDYDSANFKGINNPHWKGGISPERQCFYATREWQEAADVVIKRDNNKCQRCGNTSEDCKRLEIHHIIPFEVERYRTVPGNLITLCSMCHGWVHSSKNIN